MAYKEVFHHIRELAIHVLPKPDPLKRYLEAGPLPDGVSETDYWISRNDFFNGPFLTELRDLRKMQAKNRVLTKGRLDELLEKWEAHSDIHIKPRHLYDLARLNIVPGCSPKGYTEPDYYDLSKMARDNLRPILLANM